MVAPESCCCCSIRTACLLLGSLTLIFYSYQTFEELKGVDLWINFDDEARREEAIQELIEDHNYDATREDALFVLSLFYHVCIPSVIFCAATALTSLCLLIALLVRKRKLLIPVFLVVPAECILRLLVLILIVYKSGFSKYFWGALIYASGRFVVNSIMTFCVYSYYRYLKEEEAESNRPKLYR